MLALYRVVTAGLVVCAVLGAAACGGGKKTVTVKTVTTTATSSSTSSGGGSAPPSTSGGSASRVLQVANFRSPTGNIGCVIVAGTARCDITNRSWSPPARPSSCSSQVDFGQGLEVGHGGRGRFVCAGDTARDPSSPTLDYGTATKVDGFLCISRRNGFACSDTSTGHGFAIGAQGYRLF